MDKAKATAGLLPLYLKQHDDRHPERRARVEGFYRQIASELEHRGLRVLTCPVCRLRAEFDEAVRGFEERGAEAIITLHLAYSPSLESAETLARSRLPVIVCDTTPSHSCGPEQDPDELPYNCGIHGAQDLCNLLLRYGKPYHIEAGHWQKSDVLKRVARHAQSARMATRVRTLRAGLIGEPFTGTGDFYVSPSDLKRHLGVETRSLHPKQLKSLLASVSEQEINQEQEEDRKRFTVDAKLGAESHRRCLRAGLALRKWVDKERLGAFSFNLPQLHKASGLQTVPYLEASKLMAAGIGYAGEGDLLTASLAAGLAAAGPRTSFTEMFCPDWKNGAVYLSHTGEMNWRLAASRPRLLEMPQRDGEAHRPVYPAARFAPGDILLVNLLPLEPLREGRYRLLIAPAAMLGVKSKDRMGSSVHGWCKPKLPLDEFLAQYSRWGGTHHLALSYDLPVALVRTFGQMMGWEVLIID